MKLFAALASACVGDFSEFLGGSTDDVTKLRSDVQTLCVALKITCATK